jgi:hypothetical protein
MKMRVRVCRHLLQSKGVHTRHVRIFKGGFKIGGSFSLPGEGLDRVLGHNSTDGNYSGDGALGEYNNSGSGS